jgi:hypothetical protein
MPARAFDDRVGFFQTKFTEFESSEGEAFSKGGVIWRHRLEKADPRAAVSEPVKPIVFYVSREVPERWRPYVRAGIEFMAAGIRGRGFSQRHHCARRTVATITCWPRVLIPRYFRATAVRPESGDRQTGGGRGREDRL